MKVTRFAIVALPLLALAGAATSGGIDPPPAAPSMGRDLWSIQPIAKPIPPDVRDSAWAISPIDRFVLARLEAKGLKPVRPADKRTLIRRATFDLTGLPPTPDQVHAFLADDSPDAFAKVVLRLLESPAYGERWGRHWLDVVRYADTAGETADYPVREAYKYRNYVIDAFNHDKPYDEFIREQIAGDILARAGPPEKYSERVTATGFLALSRRFGFDPQNYHHLTIQDTLDTLGQAVLGLSLGCARCHDHKYDPVTMIDYYGLYGIFASTRYAFPGSEERKAPSDFVPLLPAAAAEPLKIAYDAELAKLADDLKQLEAEKSSIETEIKAAVDIDGGFEFQPVGVGPTAPWGHLEGARVTAAAQSPYKNLYAAGSHGVNLPNNAANNALVQSLTPHRTAAGNEQVCFNLDFRVVSAVAGGNGSYRVYLGNGPGTSAAVEVFMNAGTFVVRNGDAREAVRELKPGTWYNVQLVLDLKSKTFSGTIGVPDDVTTFAARAFATGWNGNLDYFFVDGYGHIAGPKPEIEVDNIGIRDKPIPPISAAQPGEPPAKAGEDEATMVSKSLQRVSELRAQLAVLPKRRSESERRRVELAERGPFPVAYAVSEGMQQNARIQKRGEPRNLGDEVPRQFIKVLGDATLPSDTAGSGRLQLAEWLTQRENPLAARVMVNRIWQHHFGNGLVATENDFGTRGRHPTHPELLDYMASRFISDGWSVKAVHRLIMLSRAYQLSSDVVPQAAAIDPDNELLSHFNRQRLAAESIRDAMLYISGNLDLSPGGPHSFPPVTQWGFTQHTPFNAVYDSNHRSVYLMTQRIKRHPFLSLFDGADANSSTAKRLVTTVPTQALFMMNDPFVHAQSAGLARRLLADPEDDAARIALAFDMALSRPPSQAERQESLDFVRQYDDLLQTTQVPPAERKTQCWAAFVRTLFCRNEFVFVE